MTNKEELRERWFENHVSVESKILSNKLDFSIKLSPDGVFNFFWQEIEKARKERDEEILTDLYRIMGNTAGCGMDDIFLYAQKLGIDLTNVKHQDLTN